MAGLVRGSCSASGALLAEIADSLAQPRGMDQRVVDSTHRSLTATIERLGVHEESPAGLTRGAAAARLGALAGQLRAAVDCVRTGASEGGGGTEGGRSFPRDLRSPVAVVRANLSLEWRTCAARRAEAASGRRR